MVAERWLLVVDENIAWFGHCFKASGKEHGDADC